MSNQSHSLTTTSSNIPLGTWEIKDENKQGKREGFGSWAREQVPTWRT